ncbi:redoxin domain-containing protein [Virgibacillus soli]|uniref:redoxin domain-containing protein n=1 Tax=Paracerasibacillus soli TaxID=480284 RepID=UPI0035ECC865
MKRTIIVIILIGMFGWAIYSFAIDHSGKQESELDEEVGLEKGNIAPDFKLKTLAGDEMALSDFRGQRVLVNFWASWCGPCRAEMPDMQKFHEEKDIVILAVNLTGTETSHSNVTDFVDEYGLTFPILLDEDSLISGLYQIQPIPTTFLIDSDGRIHNKAFGALNYEQMVQEFEKMK